MIKYFIIYLQSITAPITIPYPLEKLLFRLPFFMRNVKEENKERRWGR
jgi:hypothetical protein